MSQLLALYYYAGCPLLSLAVTLPPDSPLVARYYRATTDLLELIP
ncbi:hypothetical protein ACILPN_15450 [Yersinia wautersii]|nr:hypothetical protein [Yersinia pseudotuberculosis]